MRKQIQQTAVLLGTVFLFASCSKYADDMSAQNEQLLPETAAKASAIEQVSDEAIVFSMVVQLTGSEEVPSVNTETKGIAILRISKSKKLYSKIIAHVHAGMAGANGPVRVTLAANASEFGINKVIQLTDAQFNLITEGFAYVNVHSNFFPAGIIRGQIR
jgi:hypothetical protein